MILIPSYKFKHLRDIDPNFFSGTGLIIFDLDNTLVFSETAESPKEIISWLASIKKKYNCICVSNSRTAKNRSGRIFATLGADIFLSKKKKPSKKLFNEIKNKYKPNGKIFVVGDRVFTDVLFGNLSGAETILVKPLSEKENILIKILRKIENALLFLINFMYNKKAK